MNSLPVASRLRQQLGLWRSLAIYYGNPARQRQMRQFYGQFIQPGDLCFDIGAHVGNRIRPWLQLGARVVALEPQPHLMRTLERFYGQSPRAILVQQAAGAQSGTATLLASPINPSVATLSREWIEAVRQDEGFAAIIWEPAGQVAVTTLDALISQYGRPAYCKIDVEGFELEVLNGLSQPVPVVSFEYIPVAIDRVQACVARLGELGVYVFNWFEGETHHWQSDEWFDASAFTRNLARLGSRRRSGDIFARCLSVA